MQQDSPDAASLATSLAALKDRTFLLGPGFIDAGLAGVGFSATERNLIRSKSSWLPARGAGLRPGVEAEGSKEAKIYAAEPPSDRPAT
jgi:hypothetical protein